MRLKTTILIAVISTCSYSGVSAKGKTLLDVRAGHKTKLVRQLKNNDPIPKPPAATFSLIKYSTPIGKMSALLSKPKDPNKKYPAIIWVTGGFPPGGIGASAWTRVSASNDQSAKVYRKAGMIMMYPFFRGSHGNPGVREGFYGEVNDVISAYNYLKRLKNVDPNRIYLGGHSTGATLVLLVAASTHKFRAVFAFGPVSNPVRYGSRHAHHDTSNSREVQYRAPINYMHLVKTPTYIIEGTDKSNHSELMALKKASKGNKNVHIISVEQGTHFNILSPINGLIAHKLTTERSAVFKLSAAEVQQKFNRFIRSYIRP